MYGVEGERKRQSMPDNLTVRDSYNMRLNKQDWMLEMGIPTP
jgi:hypothetical protein